MILLGIDASSNWLNVVLGENSKIINNISISIPKQHISILYGSIDKILKKTGFNIKDVDVFIVVRGPGFFTGIRIGVTAVKGLVYALGKEVVSLSSLDLLAQNAINYPEQFVVPLIDARRGQIYTACYVNNGNIAVKIKNDMLIKVEDISSIINESTVLLGNGIGVYRKEIAKAAVNKKVSILNEDNWLLNSENIIKLGYSKYKNRGSEDIFDLKPLYIYSKECTIRR